MRTIDTEYVPSGIAKVYERETDALANKLHNMCRMMIKALAAEPLKRLKIGKIIMGMGTYNISGKLSYLDDGDEYEIHIHELSYRSPSCWYHFGVQEDEIEPLQQFFGTLDFWLEVSGGQDMVCSD